MKLIKCAKNQTRIYFTFYQCFVLTFRRKYHTSLSLFQINTLANLIRMRLLLCCYYLSPDSPARSWIVLCCIVQDETALVRWLLAYYANSNKMSNMKYSLQLVNPSRVDISQIGFQDSRLICRDCDCCSVVTMSLRLIGQLK